MTDLAARLRDVLSDNGVRQAHIQNAVLADLLPLVLSLQEEQRREMNLLIDALHDTQAPEEAVFNEAAKALGVSPATARRAVDELRRASSPSPARTQE